MCLMEFRGECLYSHFGVGDGFLSDTRLFCQGLASLSVSFYVIDNKRKDMTLASPEIIYVSVVIDTDYVKDNYSPNTDKNNPKGIAHNSQYLIVDYQHVYANQATADLHIKANPNDTVRFYGTCIQANSSDAVLLYGMPKFGGEQIFGPFRYSPFTLDNAVMPDSTKPDGLPPLTT